METTTRDIVTLEPGTYDWNPSPRCKCPFVNTDGVSVTRRDGQTTKPADLLWRNVEDMEFEEDIMKVHLSQPKEVYADMLSCFVTPGKAYLEPGKYTWTPPKGLETGHPFVIKPLVFAVYRNEFKDYFSAWDVFGEIYWKNNDADYDIVSIDLQERAEVKPHLLQYFTKEKTMESTTTETPETPDTTTETSETPDTTTLAAGIWAWNPSGIVYCPFAGPLNGVDVILDGDIVRKNGCDVRYWSKGIHLEVTEVRLSSPTTIYSWAVKFFKNKTPDFTQPSDLPGIASAKEAEIKAAAVTPAPAAMVPAKTKPVPKPAFVCGLGVVAGIGQKPSLQPLQ